MEYYRTTELYHYGLKGMKWGVRRWQNADGTFNEAGKKRYFDSEGSAKGNARRALAKVYDINERFYSKHGNSALASMNKERKEHHLQKAADADKRKADKQAAKEKAINDRIKNAKSAYEAERALTDKVRNDLAKTQGPLTRAVSNITGRNQSVAKHLVGKLANQTMMDVNKNARSSMTMGQKAVDLMVLGGSGRYTSGGYKNLSKAYDSYKSNVGLKAAEKDYRKYEARRRVDKRRRERRAEMDRQYRQKMAENRERRRALGLDNY